jgi:hypothetical protein
MRTTVTLDPDVARLLDHHARQTRKSFKATLNAAVRAAYGQRAGVDTLPPFEVKARPMHLRTGVDASRLNSLLDDLEADQFLEKTTAPLTKTRNAKQVL